MAEVYLGLGSNLGDREEMIRRALAALPGHGVAVRRVSSVIETAPVGGPPQGRFLNAVVLVETGHDPLALLGHLKEIEAALGRIPSERFGPRAIDIDILLYDRCALSTPTLTIPHPRMWERDFVMIPLRELAGDIRPEMFPAIPPGPADIAPGSPGLSP